tara:strand:+ start:446 stop:1693 length:1248 start_codon:yes stop_codon:yes gene_type:complete
MVVDVPELVTTSVFSRILKAYRAGLRRVFLEGGTWSSKTYSSLQFLKLVAETSSTPILISCVSESVPHLKRGMIRDFQLIMGSSFDDKLWNKTDSYYDFPSGVRIEFFSADEPSKLRGGRRDILFVNEANNVFYDAFRELDMRTRLFTICDWNPVSEFWYHENQLGDLPENIYIHSTYLDAVRVVPEQVRLDIEAYKDRDPNWWRIYGLGLIGKVEGLVYPYFQQVDELPSGDIFYGLDFGYLVDPTVLVANVIIGDRLYSHEAFYDESGLTNDMIARKMDLAGVRKGYDEIFADPSEPKSIEEIHTKDFNIKEAVKGAGSVEYGIQKVNQFIQHWTKDSLNCIKEQRNFRYVQDKDSKLTEKTTHRWSHGLDARRYALATYNSGIRERPRSSRSSFSFNHRDYAYVNLTELLGR